jgi:hypothetical protein
MVLPIILAAAAATAIATRSSSGNFNQMKSSRHSSYMPDGTTAVGMKVTQHKLGDLFPMNGKNVGGFVDVISKVSDEIIVGATLNSGNSVFKSAFARFDLGKGFIANLRKEGTAPFKGDVFWQEEQFRGHASHSTVGCTFDSSLPQVIDRVSYTCTSAGWTLNPSVSWKTRKVDLVASALCSDDTRVTVTAKGDGSSNIKVEHQLASDTLLSVKSDGVDTKGMVLEMDHHLDRKNTVKPRFDVGARSFSLAWVHCLDPVRSFAAAGAPPMRGPSSSSSAARAPVLSSSNFAQPGQFSGLPASDSGRQSTLSTPLLLEKGDSEGRTLTVKVQPRKYVAVELEGSRDGDWAVSLWSPWGELSGSSLSIGRKMLM